MKDQKKTSKFFKENLPTYYYIFTNNKTPGLAKGLIVVLIMYVISPIDIIPDTIPLLGLVDDLVLFPLTGKLVSILASQDVIKESQEKTDRLWFNSKKYKRFKLIAILILLLILFIVFRNLIQN